LDIQTIIAIIGGVLSIIAVLVAVARFFSENQRKVEQLTNEIKALKDQSTVLRTTIRHNSDGTSADTYNRIAELSGEAAKAVRSEIHSISIPIPSTEPTHLKIVYENLG
jgi:hypothetical protein